MFWFIAFFLSLAVLILVLPPLLRSSGDKSPDHQRLNDKVFVSQLQELDHDLAEGNIGEPDYALARIDLERSFLDNSDNVKTTRLQEGRATFVAGMLTIAIPLGALLVYQHVGAGPYAHLSPQANPHAGLDMTNAHASLDMPVDVNDMLTRVRQRVEDNPGDLDAWAMLGRSMYALGDLDEARNAFRQAVEGGLEDATLFAQYADLLAHQAGILNMSGDAYKLIMRALEIEPDHAQALWLAGSAAYEDNELALAEQYWQRLQVLFPPGTEAAEVIEDNMRIVREEMTAAKNS